MVNVYDGLEDILLKEFDEVDKNAAINDILDYSLRNSDETDGFDNETDRINAVPGLADKILAARNAPASERERVPRELFHV
ncbi:hypothetical protein R80B4_01384 [Fibrobacteres bacterium R8-0-B4]